MAANFIPLDPPPGSEPQGENPFAKFVTPTIEPQGENPFAKFVKAPTTVEDIKKTAVPSLIDAGIKFATAPAAIGDLAGKGFDYLTGTDLYKNLPEVKDFPNYTNVLKDVEKLWGGPLPEPQTHGGKVLKKAAEVAPYVALGPGGWGAKALMTAGSAVGSEAASEAAKKYGLGPTGQTVADITGGLVGGITPAVVAGKVFPAIPALRNSDIGKLGELGVDVGAARVRPNLAQRSANLGESTAHEIPSFSAGVAKKSGIEAGPDGRITAEAIKKGGDALKTEYDTLLANNSIQGQLFQDIKTSTLPQIRAKAFRVLGNKEIGPVDEAIDDIVKGAGNTNRTMNIPGDRYAHMRDTLDGKIRNAPNDATKDAFVKMKEALDDAFEASLTSGSAKELHKRYANFNIVSNANLGSDELLTPEKLSKAIKSQWGEGAYARDRGLTPDAKAGERVLTDLPKPKEPSGVLSKTGAYLAGIMGANFAGAAPEAATAGIGSMMALEPTIGSMLYRNPVTKYAYTNPMTQALLKAHTDPIGLKDVPTVAALLAGKPAVDYTTPLLSPTPMRNQSQSNPLVRR